MHGRPNYQTWEERDAHTRGWKQRKLRNELVGDDGT